MAVGRILTFLPAGAALAAIFRRKVGAYIRQTWYERHVIVCGLGRKGWFFVREFRKAGFRVLVIEKDSSNPMIRECEKMLVPVLIGNAQDPILLEDANIARADRLICVCGDDGTNAEIAVHAQQLVGYRGERPLMCLVHIFSPRLCTLLRARVVEMAMHGFRVEFFNVFHNGALMLLQEANPFEEKSAGGVALPHLLVIGLGWFGESIVIEAARNWKPHYENSARKLIVTVIDHAATRKSEYLWSRYRGLDDVCELKPVDLEIESREFVAGDFLATGPNVPRISMIYVCLNDQSLGLTAAINLRRRTRSDGIPILLQADHDAGFAKMLPKSGRKPSALAGIYSFGLFERTCNTAAIDHAMIERTARAVHEDYVAQLRLRGVTAKQKPLMKPWETLTEEEKESNRRQADHIAAKLQRVGCAVAPRSDWSVDVFEFTPDEVKVLARMEHDRWCKEKVAQGYRHGTVRDDDEKVHDCLVSWDKLSKSDKMTDIDAARNIPKMLASEGLDIYRIRRRN